VILNILGPLVRIGPDQLICSDPEVLRRMSAVRSPYRKGLFYETGRMVPGEDNVVTLRDDEKHKALRAKLAAAVSTPSMERDSHYPTVLSSQK